MEGTAASTEAPQRLPRSDIPPDYKCPFEACTWRRPENKRPELTYRNHMAAMHGIYYEKAVPSAVSQKLAAYPKYTDSLREAEDLKPWHCVALARHVVYGQQFTDIGKEMKHSAQAISQIAKSPAGQAFIAKMTEELKDPVKLVKDLMKSDTLEMHLMWLQARDWAFQAKDYEAIHKMAKDIGLQPVVEDGGKNGPTKISLHLNMTDLSAPAVRTSYQLMEAEIVEEAAGSEHDQTE